MPTHCDRCGRELKAWSTSFFNTDNCCIPCIIDEREAPGYAAAKEEEVRQVRNGNFNFVGVGLSTEDQEFLRIRREAR